MKGNNFLKKFRGTTTEWVVRSEREILGYKKSYRELARAGNGHKCCENPKFRHDKVRGEIFCVNCGMVIVERTIGQGGRRGGMWLGST